MKSHHTKLFIPIFIFSLFFGIAGVLKAQTLVIDNFNKKPTNTAKKYSNYINTQDGYDIYYAKADLNLSRVPISTKDTCDKVLRLEYSLSPGFAGENWLSIRREFQAPLDLENYKVLKLNVRVENPSPNVFIRITLSDITNDPKRGEEMWWFDCDKNLLRNKSHKWIQICVPFDGFKVSYGVGTRHNDYKLNLEKIIAYEISLISESAHVESGIVFFDYLRTFK